MNEDKKNVDFEQINALNSLLLDSVKNQKENFSMLKNLFVVTVISFSIIICSGIIGFFWYESQFDYERETTEETTTKEVYTNGDNSDANIIEGDQYNDSSQHNE